MVKERQILLKRLMLTLDLFVICITFFVGFLLKNNFEEFFKDPMKYMVVLPVLLVIWGGLLSYFGLYESFRTKQITDVLLIVTEAGLFGWAFFSGFLYAEIGRAHV